LQIGITTAVRERSDGALSGAIQQWIFHLRQSSQKPATLVQKEKDIH